MPENRRIFITQPYFLPWISFFARIHASSRVIFLDDNQYKSQYYSNRARLRSRNGDLFWLTIPVLSGVGPLRETRLANSIQADAVRVIESEYGNAGGTLIPPVIDVLSQNQERLLELNVSLIVELYRSIFGVGMLYSYASDAVSADLDRTDALIGLARAYGASEIVCGWGASARLHDQEKMGDAGVRFIFQDKFNTSALVGRRPLDMSIIDWTREHSTSEIKSLIQIIAKQTIEC